MPILELKELPDYLTSISDGENNESEDEANKDKHDEEEQTGSF